MAASEARAAWQRMANRCIVQEDAKRAPKLACYPSSTTKLLPDPTAGNAPHRSDQPASNFISPSCNSSDVSSIPPDPKWWLHAQPYLGAMYDDDIGSGMNHDASSIVDKNLQERDERENEKLKAVDQPTFRKSEKSMEPWWCITDEDELASFVSRKSLERFENCDLPQPRIIHFYIDQLSCVDFRDDHKSYPPSGFSMQQISAPGQRCRGRMEDLELKRVDLLEALQHSQTRAREAERAAHQAHAEKEHIVDLFFKQAFSLFAYRQWVKMLQLETLFLRVKMKEPYSLSSWSTPSNGVPRSKKRTLRQLTCRLCKLAVNVGLAAVGLIFGWTLGRFLPIF